MTDTSASLQRKISSASDLQSVVRTMKAMAASSITQYENAANALDGYLHMVNLALAAAFQQADFAKTAVSPVHHRAGGIGAIVFGTDQGLVGDFNDVMVDFVVKTLRQMPGDKTVMAVGERLQSRLESNGLNVTERFELPHSVAAITPLVGQALIALDALREKNGIEQIYLFFQRPASAVAYEPTSQRLLPLDAQWHRERKAMAWPRPCLPEVLANKKLALQAFIREYLFVSIFRACAQSLASENASRLMAMQRAEKNISDMLDNMNQTFHQLRQSGIDEELFDVTTAYFQPDA